MHGMEDVTVQILHVPRREHLEGNMLHLRLGFKQIFHRPVTNITQMMDNNIYMYWESAYY